MLGGRDRYDAPTAQVSGALTSRLGRRFVLLFTLCALLPLVVFATLSVTTVSEQVRQDTRESLRNAAKSAGMAIAGRLDQIANGISLAGDLVQHWRSDGAWFGGDAFKAKVAMHCRAMWLVDGDHVEVLSGDLEYVAVAMTGDERAHLAAGKPLLQTVGDPAELMMSLDIDMKDGEDIRVVALINADWLWDPAELRGSNCEFAASDVRGTMLCRTFHDDPAASVVATKVINEGLSGKTAASGSLDWTLAGEPHVGRYWQAFLKPQYAMDMWMIQLRPRADAFAVDREFGRFFWLTAFGTLLVVVLASLTQIRRTLDPIVSLQRATGSIGRGDLDIRVAIDSPDEFGDLGSAFNDMAERLQENIAQREQTEVELVASRDAALLAMQAKAEFVTNVSHEFRTPMTEILGATEILTQVESGAGEDAAIWEEFSGIALHGAQRLAKLLDDVLELGDVESGGLVAVNVEASIRSAVARLEPDLRGRVRLEVDEELPAVAADDHRVAEVWVRLLENAGKFSAATTPVCVRGRLVDGHVCVEVVDRGVGIAPEDLERVFDPFSQVGQNQLVNKASGTGLGLTLARSAIETFGGSVTVRSKLGEGSVFRVTLPEAVVAADRD